MTFYLQIGLQGVLSNDPCETTEQMRTQNLSNPIFYLCLVFSHSFQDTSMFFCLFCETYFFDTCKDENERNQVICGWKTSCTEHENFETFETIFKLLLNN